MGREGREPQLTNPLENKENQVYPPRFRQPPRVLAQRHHRVGLKLPLALPPSTNIPRFMPRASLVHDDDGAVMPGEIGCEREGNGGSGKVDTRDAEMEGMEGGEEWRDGKGDETRAKLKGEYTNLYENRIRLTYLPFCRQCAHTKSTVPPSSCPRYLTSLDLKWPPPPFALYPSPSTRRRPFAIRPAHTLSQSTPPILDAFWRTQGGSVHHPGWPRQCRRVDRKDSEVAGEGWILEPWRRQRRFALCRA